MAVRLLAIIFERLRRLILSWIEQVIAGLAKAHHLLSSLKGKLNRDVKYPRKNGIYLGRKQKRRPKNEICSTFYAVISFQFVSK